MTSGKLKPKPCDIARKRLESRARKAIIESGVKVLGRLTDAQKKTPSQKRSENGRKKEKRRAEK